jgi:hypothetical protein
MGSGGGGGGAADAGRSSTGAKRMRVDVLATCVTVFFVRSGSSENSQCESWEARANVPSPSRKRSSVPMSGRCAPLKTVPAIWRNGVGVSRPYHARLARDLGSAQVCTDNETVGGRVGHERRLDVAEVQCHVYDLLFTLVAVVQPEFGDMSVPREERRRRRSRRHGGRKQAESQDAVHLLPCALTLSS